MARNPKRSLLIAAAATVALAGAAGWTLGETSTPAGATVVDVWKSPSCGCCGGWIEHMRDAGFAVTVRDTEDMAAVKAAKGVPEALGSCHTAVVDGYVVEGHVPAGDIRRLLAERPQAKGLAAPGMPQDAPGMDMNSGEPYQVTIFGDNGSRGIFARH